MKNQKTLSEIKQYFGFRNKNLNDLDQFSIAKSLTTRKINELISQSEINIQLEQQNLHQLQEILRIKQGLIRLDVLLNKRKVSKKNNEPR